MRKFDDQPPLKLFVHVLLSSIKLTKWRPDGIDVPLQSTDNPDASIFPAVMSPEPGTFTIRLPPLSHPMIVVGLVPVFVNPVDQDSADDKTCADVFAT